MRGLVRRAMKVLAIAVAVSPFVALAALLLWVGTGSLVMVAPGTYKLAAAIFIIPLLTGWGLYRLANSVR